jgi:hypothetical protein
MVAGAVLLTGWSRSLERKDQKTGRNIA